MTLKKGELKETALKTWVVLLVIIGIGAGLLFIYSVRSVILEVVAATILAIALAPLMRFFTKRHMNRVLASVLTLIIGVLALLLIIGAIASPLITQSNGLINNAPKLLDKVESNSIVKQLDSQFHVIKQIKAYTAELPTLLSQRSSTIISAVGSAFHAATEVVIIFVLTLFILMEGPAAWRQFIRVLGPKNGSFVNMVARKIEKAVGGYITGNLLISLIAGIVALISLLILRVPYAFALAALVAIFDLIPLVGATIATVALALVALSQGIFPAIIIVIIMVVYQFIEGHVIQPVIYGRTVNLSQLLIILSTIIGALLGGVVGVLLAIPVAATVVIIVTEILKANGANVADEDVPNVKI